ncbi:MAG TPA: outer membrane beta-barrel protein [Bacteroidales bacterium]|nr:outer membrane beta-barrel protein [Bacteroidales bacterium]HSA42106.1 outer membrane beta-barrel protein [Bacteroidales bacterium]
MNTKTITILLMVLLIAPMTGHSQKPFDFHAGLALPLGGFANDDKVIDMEEESENCGAAPGLTAGVHMIYPLTGDGLGVFAGVDFTYNAMKKKVKDELTEEIDDGEADIHFPSYFNIPITAGLNYSFPVNEKTMLFIKLGGAYNIFKMTDLTVEFDSEKASISMNTSKKFGFLAGAGVYLNDKLSLNLSYFGLGKHALKGKLREPGEEAESLETDKAVGFATFTLAFHF